MVAPLSLPAAMPEKSSAETPAPAARFQKRPGAWRRTAFRGALTLLATTPFLAVFFFAWGVIFGSEFNPDTFQSRSFWYLRVPGTGFPITRRTVEDSSSVLQKSLAGSGWIAAGAAGRQRWDLVRDNWPRRNSHDFDAAVLVSYLEAPAGAGENRWVQWNLRHPSAAAVFWPAVADLARSGNYVLTPDLFRLAGEYQPPAAGAEDPFPARLRGLTGLLLLDRARLEIQCGQPARAAEAARLAMKYAPCEEAAALAQPPLPGNGSAR